jgi:hypothetical protein
MLDDFRIIGHSINWRLNGPHERTTPPQLSDENRELLKLMFNELRGQMMACLSSGEATLVEIGSPYCYIDRVVRFPPDYFNLLIETVASFIEELKDSRSELEIVTGVPKSVSLDLLSRMKGEI